MNILVTGTRAPCAAELVGILRRSELGNVSGADSCSWTLVPSLRLPSPIHDGLGYAQAVARLCKEHNIDLVWPTCEETFHLAKHRRSLPCPVFCPDFFVLDMLHNKRKFAELGRNLSPCVTTPSETEREPCVWKKTYSRFGCGVSRKRPSDQHGWFAQEWVDGEEFSSMIICRDGEVLLSISYKAILRHWGVAVAFSPVSFPETSEFLREIARVTSCTGVLSFDFIRRCDGKIYAIECNPRLTSAIHLLSGHEEIGAIVLGDAVVVKGLEECRLLFPTVFMLHHGRRLNRIKLVPRGVGICRQAATLAGLLARSAWLGVTPQQAATRDIEYNG